MNSFLSESQLELALEDQTVSEFSPLVLSLSTSKQVKSVEWFKDDKKLVGARYAQASDGKLHTLTINEAKKEDGGLYIAVVDEEKKSCNVIINGDLQLYIK